MDQIDLSPTMFSGYDVSHVVLPRRYRSSMTISTPCEVCESQMVEIFNASDKNTSFIISKFDVSFNNFQFHHKVEFIKLGSDLVKQLKDQGVTNAFFYVGYSEDMTQVSISNEKPEMNQVSFSDYKGNSREGISKLVLI